MPQENVELVRRALTARRARAARSWPARFLWSPHLQPLTNA